MYLFHHIHHQDGAEIVHHCGRAHSTEESGLDYIITHCSCQKHSINRESAIGHAYNEKVELILVVVKFKEVCPDGGWHIESGEVV